MRIAIIGPGIMTIPPLSWGAVEIIIWNHLQYLERIGHEVVVFNNPNLQEVADQINREHFDFVHLQYDVYAGFFAKALRRDFFLTSHYGWLAQVDRWDETYKKIFQESLQVPGIIALSEEGKKVYERAGYRGPIRVLRNGVEVEKFRFLSYGNGRAVCVGNIVPRKRQAFLADALRKKVSIDFYGPNFEGGRSIDADVVQLLPEGKMDFACINEVSEFKENETARYCGVWKKEDLYKNLSYYSCLVLISESENDPLVVKEALAAGLSVVVSEAAAANLTPQPFITVLNEREIHSDRLAEAVRQAVHENKHWRSQIRLYARERFDYSVVILDYLKIISEFVRPPFLWRKSQTKPSLATTL